MTTLPILETLAREFKTSVENVRAALEMIDAGLTAPFIGRYRRAQVGALSESLIRRLDRNRQQLEELERRKGTILRLLEKEPDVPEGVLAQIRDCTDRFEVEDLFLPHRRPEPEVQLALDRGLGALADLIVKPLPKEERVGDDAEGDEDADDADDDAPHAAAAPAHEEPAHEAPAADVAAELAAAEAEHAAEPDAGAEAPSHDEGGDAPAEPAPEAHAPKAHEPSEAEAAQTILTPELARLCAEFVSPDKGVHNESEALAGAMRILSDRLGRSARLRGQLRRMLRKHGLLGVRALVDEKKAGRHKGLLRISQPLRQIQGNRLLALRQAQKERVLTTRITVDTEQAMQKVVAGLGKHLQPAVQGVVREVCRRALERRLLPMIEEDIRLELKERADAEALRFLSQHLRQLLLTPVLARRGAVVGVDVNAKGDWILCAVGRDGEVITPEELRIEVGDKDAAALGAELAAALGDKGIDAAAVSSSKQSRAILGKLRQAFAASGLGVFPFLVVEAGLSSYANSEQARKELAELSISQRMAVSLARRLQDPLEELLKIDPRHLSLGSEQGLVSKANVRRCFIETIESSVAHIGCDVNRAPAHVLAALPGLDAAAAKRILEYRANKHVESRDELRDEGVLSEAEWTSAIGFLRVYGSPEPLDRSNLHPEQYVLARRLIEAVGSTIDEGLGRPGITKGLKREDFEVDEDTWRDMMRELAHPGRDPRLRLFVPELLPADSDRARLTKDRVVEGQVSNVTSFGAFVDVGLDQDAMIHISEISSHYVRDARELLSIGQLVRARILEGSGQRVTLSLKNVPRDQRERPSRGPRQGGGGRGGHRGGGGGGGRGPRQRDERPKTNLNLRAAQSRRDGLGGTGGGGGGRGGGGARWAGGRVAAAAAAAARVAIAAGTRSASSAPTSSA
ncbi:MAG: S1 RNA-binding domain-containing protein [Planctomycetes bacterium]|nr:S1 RNA-binding domain-containing protein [Planctomycetota bacterium]